MMFMIKIWAQESLRCHSPASFIRLRSAGFRVPFNYTRLSIRVHLHTLASQVHRGRDTYSFPPLGRFRRFTVLCRGSVAVANAI